MADTTAPAVSQRSVDARAADNAYGDGVNRKAVQQATPGSPNGPNGPTGVRTAVAAAAPDPRRAPALPGELPGLTDPSMRPDEPLQAGMPTGPGPGPEVLAAGVSPQADPQLWELRALAERFNSPVLLRMIALAESEL